ncbi:MAG: DsbA family protein [Bryobacteraceae bacterium]
MSAQTATSLMAAIVGAIEKLPTAANASKRSRDRQGAVERIRATSHAGRTAACLLLLPLLTLAGVDVCRDVSPAEGDRLAHYVAQKYRVPAHAALRLESQEQVGETCYRKVVFRGDGALGPYLLALYASPDLRFLSSDILDSTVDPEREERAEAEKRMGQLLDGEYAALGPAAAPVTVVVFSDFECPYCKKLRVLLAAEPLVASGGKVRLVFRHMPMHAHQWAQKAAEAAACAQIRNADAFWRLHDSLFENQEKITAENVAQKVDDLAARIETLSIRDFRDCLNRQMSLGMVLRDRQIGTLVGVIGTPTMFINGEPLTGLPDAAELHRRLAEALDSAAAHVAGAR